MQAIIFATLLTNQMYIMTEIGVPDKAADVAQVAVWTIILYAFWPLLMALFEYLSAKFTVGVYKVLN